MGSPDPLDAVHELARDAAASARRRLGETLSDCRQSEERLRVLEGYRAEYEQRLKRAVSGGISATVLANYRQFLDRLGEAIAQAAAELDASRRRVTVGQASVLAEDRRVKSFDTLAERRERCAATAEARRDQKQTDELAARSAARTSGRG